MLLYGRYFKNHRIQALNNKENKMITFYNLIYEMIKCFQVDNHTQKGMIIRGFYLMDSQRSA